MFRMRAARQERGRLAHVCINLRSTSAQRGRLAQVCTNLGINVGESPTLLSPDQSLHSRGHFVSAQPHMLFAELKHVFL